MTEPANGAASAAPQTVDVEGITFEIDGMTYTMMPPTSRQAFRISRACHGLTGLAERIGRTDLDAYAVILRVGCAGVPEGEDALQDFVFAHLDALVSPVVRYALALENGGRIPPAEPDSDEAGNAAAAPGETPQPAPEAASA